MLAFALPSFAQENQPVSAQKTQATDATAESQPPNTVDLNTVIKQVKAAVDEYQRNRGSGPDALPPLSLAEFDFRTTTGTVGGLTINLFIFNCQNRKNGSLLKRGKTVAAALFGGALHEEEGMHELQPPFGFVSRA